MSSTLPQIARRAIANAQSLLRFEKDRPAVYRDALHDHKDLWFSISQGRLWRITQLLVKATEYASMTDEIDAAAKLALTGLCDWADSELARQPEMIE